MQLLAEIHRAAGINIHGKAMYRAAVRAVILRGRELLMVYSSNVGDYKFPGGGVDQGESHVQALAREIDEECGLCLLQVSREIGSVLEYIPPTKPDYALFKNDILLLSM
jgi:8-oxo-dGTP diphosphatase